MNSPLVGLRVAATVFGIVCLAHFWRVLAHMSLRLDNFEIPQWLSLVAATGAGVLSAWLWRLSTKVDRA